MMDKEELLSLLDGTGLDQKLLQVYDSVANITGDVDSSIREGRPESGTSGVILFPLIPAYRSLCFRFCILADAFERRGFDSVILVDDDYLSAPIERTVDENRAITSQTKFFRKTIPEKFGLEVTKLSSVASRAENSGYSDLGHIDVEKFAKSSTRKHLKKYNLDLSDEAVREKYNQFLGSANSLAEILPQVYEENDVVATLVHEPYYIQGGIPLKVSDIYGAHSYSQMWGYRSNYILFGKSTNASPLPQYIEEDLVESELETALSPASRERIESILKDRKKGQNVDVDYTSSTDYSVDMEEDTTLVTVFTNLLWDASLEPEGAIYSDVYNWLGETVASFSSIEDVYLVIKTHPAEDKFGTNESVYEWVTEELDLPPSIDILPPSTEVNTYSLLAQSDATIVYNSTVGLEAACMRVPVLVAGDTHYDEHGFTVNVDTKKEYKRKIQSIDTVCCDDNMKRRAIRYANLLFVKKHIPFEFCQREFGATQKFETVGRADTDEGMEPFDSVVSAISSGKPVLNPKYSPSDKQK
jgi:hypothetical protein